MKLTDFKVLTFDCYGTLIDWETGIMAMLQPLIGRASSAPSSAAALERFAEYESTQESETPGMPYSQLLAVVYEKLAHAWGVSVSAEQASAFGASIPSWPEFPDSADALQYLKQHFKLVVLSNVDRESFAASQARLRVDFDAVYTAQDIGSYKPSLRNFHYLLRHLSTDFGFEPGDVLHVAESLFHDHAPANEVGLASAWIHRRHGKEGWGATQAPAVMPRFDFRFESMAALAQAHRECVGGGR